MVMVFSQYNGIKEEVTDGTELSLSSTTMRSEASGFHQATATSDVQSYQGKVSELVSDSKCDNHSMTKDSVKREKSSIKNPELKAFNVSESVKPAKPRSKLTVKHRRKATITSSNPRPHSTVSSSNPRPQPTVSSSDPRPHSTIKSSDPRSEPTVSSSDVAKESSLPDETIISKHAPSFKVSRKMRFLISKAITSASKKADFSTVSRHSVKSSSVTRPQINSSSESYRSSDSIFVKDAIPCSSLENSQVQENEFQSDRFQSMEVLYDQNAHQNHSMKNKGTNLSQKLFKSSHARSVSSQRKTVFYRCPYCSYKIHKLYVYSRHLAKHKRFLKVAKKLKCSECLKCFDEERKFSLHKCSSVKSANKPSSTASSKHIVAVHYVDLIPLLMLKDILVEGGK